MLPACSRTPDSPSSPPAATSAPSRPSTTGTTGRCSASAATWSARRDEAEDALQQTFLRAHRALLAHGAPDDPRPWLFSIARNRCKTLLAARRAEAEVDETLPATAGLAEEVQARADLRAVVEDVARLPDDQRAALVLSELADLSHAQIGDVIGVRAGKVKALVHQARTTLIAERDAREQPCDEIREQIATARGGALRRGPLRRHLRLCAPCRAYRDAVAAQRRTLAAVLPVAPSAGLKAGILGAATGGGGAGLSAGLATKLAASAIVVGGATGGGVALDTPKPPPRPPAAKAVAPTPARTAVPPGPVVAVGERLERKVRVQPQRRADKPARKGRERTAARRNDGGQPARPGAGPPRREARGPRRPGHARARQRRQADRGPQGAGLIALAARAGEEAASRHREAEAHAATGQPSARCGGGASRVSHSDEGIPRMSRSLLIALLAALALPGLALAANVKGTSGDDTLTGTPNADRIFGKAGNDKIDGLAGNDRLFGGRGNDTVNGGAGNDRIHGGKGDDTIDGGDGNDRIHAGHGADKVTAGAGDDVVWVRDHKADTVDCGAGDDTVFADKADTLTNCEHAKVRRGHGKPDKPKPTHPPHPPKPTHS